MSLSGLAQLSIELTSKCDKINLCKFCGHQDAAVNPIQYGDMDYELLKSIRRQVEAGITISLHRDGEPTAYPRLREALELFEGFTVSIVTHGENLVKCASAIIGHATSVTISVFKGDPDGDTQYETVKEFLSLKGDNAPRVQIKIVGDYPNSPYERLHLPILRRLIHNPTGNTHYAHISPTVPEVGICLDALHRPSIDWEGRVYLCNRLDPSKETQVGDLRCQSLDEIWNGPVRHEMIEAHKDGHREEANDLCAKCHFWGVPSQWIPQAQPKELKMVAL